MKDDSQKIESSMIFEIIGRPAKDLVVILNDIISQISKEEGVKVLGQDVKEPKKMDNKVGLTKEDSKGVVLEENEFYSTFAEVELETESVHTLAQLIFKYMPAHIEIVSPERITLTNFKWGEILSELVRRLHSYDEVARVMQVEKTILENKLKSLEPKIVPISESKKQKPSKSKPKSRKK